MRVCSTASGGVMFIEDVVRLKRRPEKYRELTRTVIQNKRGAAHPLVKQVFSGDKAHAHYKLMHAS